MDYDLKWRRGLLTPDLILYQLADKPLRVTYAAWYSAKATGAKMKNDFVVALVLILAFSASIASAAPAVSVGQSGDLKIDGLTVPLSAYLSAEAARAEREHLMHPYPVMRPHPAGPETAALRKRLDDFVFNRNLAAMSQAYPVDVEAAVIDGVRVDIVRPKAPLSAANRERVLISLHSGGFLVGAGPGAIAAAIPIAGTMGVEVISVDYRMAPEFKFPAATQDVVRVYKALLHSHRPDQIGIYGCSAGGLLAAQTVAALDAAKIPQPGAVAVLCAGGGGGGGGDSGVVAPALTAAILPPMADTERGLSYASVANTDDPLFAPVRSLDLLSRFPPTLLITSTRGSEMSDAIYFHNRLAAAGVKTELFVWEGLGHAFFDSFGDPNLPESRDAFRVIVTFFDSKLSR